MAEKKKPAFNPDEQVEQLDPLSFLKPSDEPLVNKEVKTTKFSGVNIKDFSEFDVEENVLKVGEYVFSLEQKFLKDATSITKFTSSASKSSYGTVKITLFKDKLKLSSFNQSCFSEVFIPLYQEVDLKNPISFIFDQNILFKIASIFSDTITFTFNAEKSILIVNSEKTRLEISTFPETDFIKFHSKIGEPRYISPVNVVTLRRAVQYVSLYSKRDEAQLNLSLIECRNGFVVGGSYSASGVFQSQFFNDFALKVKFEVLGIFDKILGSLSDNNSHLFETPNFYLLRDENLFFGFEKVPHSFPPIENFFKAKTTGDHILVPRSSLFNSLQKLSIISSDKNLLVHCTISGKLNEAELTLSTKDASGRQSVDALQVHRGFDNINKNPDMEKTFEPSRSFTLNILSFIKTINHFESANVHIAEILGKAILILEEEDTYKATTILSIQKDT